MKHKIIFLLMFVIFLWGELAMGENTLVIPNGRLIFGRGQSLYEMNLHSCQKKMLLSDNLSMFSKVSKVDSHRFLFLEGKPSELGIKMFDLSSNSTRLIYKEGTSPYYNAEHKKIFFNYTPSYKEGHFLYVGNLNDSSLTRVKKIAKGSVYVNDISVIPISNDEVVFNYTNSNDPILMYNMVTDKLKNLPIKNCDPQIWRSATEQLMCYSSHNKQYFLTDLAGKNIETITIKPNFWPVLYLPEYDELLFTMISFGFSPKLDPEKGSLGIYNFKTGQSKILCDDIKLGTGDAIYYED